MESRNVFIGGGRMSEYKRLFLSDFIWQNTEPTHYVEVVGKVQFLFGGSKFFFVDETKGRIVNVRGVEQDNLQELIQDSLDNGQELIIRGECNYKLSSKPSPSYSSPHSFNSYYGFEAHYIRRIGETGQLSLVDDVGRLSIAMGGELTEVDV